jgi:hypothetical protein
LNRYQLTILVSALSMGLLLVLWVVLTLTLGGIGIVDLIGWVLLYFVGLGWVSFLIELGAKQIEARRSADKELNGNPNWNPLDPASQLYGVLPSTVFFLICASVWVASYVLKSYFDSGKFWPDAPPNLLTGIQITSGILAIIALSAAVARSRRLRQTLTMLGTYSVLFTLIYVLVHLKFAKDGVEDYDVPAGGGNESVQASSVKVKKVVRKKFVINPYNSSIIFNAPPPIDKIDVKLNEDTANQYKAGQANGAFGRGKGKGGGFSSGKGSGKFGLIRIKHSDAAWNKNFGIGGDRNLLLELATQSPETKANIGDDESKEIASLARYTVKKSPPLIFIVGARSFAPSDSEKKILRQYLIERHGMILGDNLGGPDFHQSFVSAMNQITGTTSVVIPRDDHIHKSPYEVPEIPVVVAHGGTSPLGWRIDGRWVVYYHPGAISDIWSDDHAGVKKQFVSLAYQLGMNIISYAYGEHDEWLESQKP